MEFIVVFLDAYAELLVQIERIIGLEAMLILFIILFALALQNATGLPANEGIASARGNDQEQSRTKLLNQRPQRCKSTTNTFGTKVRPVVQHSPSHANRVSIYQQ